MCGNHSDSAPVVSLTLGSPPRVREPQHYTGGSSMSIRITPACAGTTQAAAPDPASRWDHPRVCGNHPVARTAEIKALGSPPRVREPLRVRYENSKRYRITPACAGTTGQGKSSPHRTQDHPRVCGNHCVSGLAKYDRIGSPPRVREPREVSPNESWYRRITPACAGTTESWFRMAQCAGDHPRVCGNHN